MLFWHLGGAIAVFRIVFKDPSADIRFLASGALLPDLFELVVGGMATSGTSYLIRFLGHSLLFCLAILIGTLVFTRPPTPARRRGALLVVGVILHLVFDLFWIRPGLLFWPLLGWEPNPPVTDWAISIGSVGGELVGLIYLTWLAYKARLGDAENLRTLLKQGRLHA
ncbi:MAG: metal-dependent hydrolase [bacterium]|nr:metal-dependent hydrolase [bacterium]